ncbi:MAG: OmpH family outer membrane protein [Alphaproteobacteria bacterium]|nr:OmpH family outer membrane protein [Alphaproteobacteria bacterium]
MKLFYMTWAMLAVFISGFFAGYIYTDTMQSKIAVVDVAKVVANSAQVQSLKAEQEMQNAELLQWIQDAQNKINSEKDKTKQEELAKQLSAELDNKRNVYGQRYINSLRSVEQNIEQTITSEAQKKGYKYIITKGMLLGGGDDITDEITKVVK